MTRWIVLLVAVAACGKTKDGTPYVHQAPAFALDVPAGYAEKLIEGGVFFRGSSEAGDIMVQWRPAGQSAAEERDELAADDRVAHHEVATGETTGGGAWESSTSDGVTIVHAFLRSGDTLVHCDAAGTAADVLAACKTLRLP